MKQFSITTNFTHRDDNLSRYLKNISHLPVLSAEEQNTLAREMKQGGKRGEEARRKLIESNLRFAVTVAKKYQDSSIPLMDLIDDANMGLCKACDAFDPEVGVKFLTYAVNHMMAEIFNDFERNGRIVRLPHDVANLTSKYTRLVEEVYKTEGRMPTMDEFAEHVGVSREKAAAVFENMGDVLSLDKPLGEESDGDTLVDILPDWSAAEMTSDYGDTRALIFSVINNTLNPDDAIIVESLSGFLGDEAPTFTELCIKLNLTDDALRKRYSRALEKIRRNEDACNELRSLLAA